jgi:hypothetical protein
MHRAARRKRLQETSQRDDARLQTMIETPRAALVLARIPLESRARLDAATRALAAGVPLCTRLDASMCSLAMTGTAAICDALTGLAAHAQRLAELDLSSNRIGDAGAASLAPVLDAIAAVQGSTNAAGRLGRPPQVAPDADAVPRDDVAPPPPPPAAAAAAAAAASMAAATTTKLPAATRPSRLTKAARRRAAAACLATLQLSANELSSDGIRSLAPTLPRSLVRLDLSQNHIGNTGARALAEGLNFARLVVLNLANNSIGDEGIAAIAAALFATEERATKVTRAESLVSAHQHHHHHHHHHHRGPTEALGHGHGVALRQLTLRGNRIGPVGARALGDRVVRHLESLDIAANKLFDAGGVLIAAALGSASRLERLDMSSCYLGEPTAAGIAAVLPGCSRLWDLALSFNAGMSCTAIVQALARRAELSRDRPAVQQNAPQPPREPMEPPIPSIRPMRLAMVANEMGDLAARHVAEAIRASPDCLGDIDLSCNEIGVDGMRELSRAIEACPGPVPMPLTVPQRIALVQGACARVVVTGAGTGAAGPFARLPPEIVRRIGILHVRQGTRVGFMSRLGVAIRVTARGAEGNSSS